MIDFLRQLMGFTNPPTKPPSKPPIPTSELEDFKAWYLAQTRPAVALIPDPAGTIGISGSRLGGPAWIAEGDAWPTDSRGVPLEFLGQLDCADCRSLIGYPEVGVIQFFVGRNDLFGADFDDPAAAIVSVRLVHPDNGGNLVPPPALEIVDHMVATDISPFEDEARRLHGIALRAEPIVDRIDPSIMAAEQRLTALYGKFAISMLEKFLEGGEASRALRHHTGGYPAYTQSDVHYQAAFAAYDHVLLRLTSDDVLMWGDVGECVFLIRSEDLRRGDFSRVAYSWDCH